MMLTTIVLSALVFAVSGQSGRTCNQNSDCGSASHDVCCAESKRCIDNRIEKCCSSTWCKDYQSCCGTVCCSKGFACTSRKTFTTADGEVENDYCSAVENFNTQRAYTAVGVPIILGVFAIVGYVLAFVMLLLHSVRFSLSAVLVIVFSLLLLLLAILVLVSQHVTAAMYLCFVAIIALLTLGATAEAHAATYIVGFSGLCTLVAFLMMIDPFTGNSLLGFNAAYPGGSGSGTTAYGGVLVNTLTQLSPANLNSANNDDGSGSATSCPGFYHGYFRRDTGKYTDSDLYDPSVALQPYSICSAQYQTYIAIIVTTITGLLPLLFLSQILRLWEVRSTVVQAN